MNPIIYINWRPVDAAVRYKQRIRTVVPLSYDIRFDKPPHKASGFVDIVNPNNIPIDAAAFREIFFAIQQAILDSYEKTFPLLKRIRRDIPSPDWAAFYINGFPGYQKMKKVWKIKLSKK